MAFQKLQFLEIRDNWSPGPGKQPVFHGSTPALQCYVSNGHSSIASFDPGNVRYLQVKETPDLSLYPRLHSLISLSVSYLGKIAQQLRQDPTTCPRLAFIICTRVYKEDEEDERWEQPRADMLRERAEITGNHIRLLGWNAENDPEFRKYFMSSKIYIPVCGR